MVQIAVLTIGQTPRPDITADLLALLPADVTLWEYGALDGLSRTEAERLLGYPGHGELLVTRMGAEQQMIELDGEKLMARLQVCIDRAEANGADLLLMACTGNFPDYRHSVPLLLPGRYQREQTKQAAQGRKVGVLIPNGGQRAQIAGWWADCGLTDVLLAAADPFVSPQQTARAALELQKQGAAVLCLDCFGYTLAHQYAAEQATGLPIILPRRVIVEQAFQQLEVSLCGN